MRSTLSNLKKRLFGATFSSIPPSQESYSENSLSYPEEISNHGRIQNPLFQNTPSPSSADSNDDIVGKTFFPVLWSMKWLGIFPVSISNSGEFYGLPSLITTLTTATTIGIVILCVSIYTLNRGFDISWPFRLWDPLTPQDMLDSTSAGGRQPPTFFVWVTLGLQVMIPASSIIYGLLGFLHIPGYSSFLNGWADYSKLLNLYFSSFSFSANFTKLRKYRKYYAFIYIPVLVVSVFIIPLLTKTKLLQITDSRFSSLSTVVTFVWVESLVVLRIITSVKDFLNLQVLEIGYGELRRGIQAQYTVLQENVNRTQVRTWMKMVLFLRDQRSLLEKHMAFQNNWMLMEIFVVTLLVLTASIVVIMHEIEEYMGLVAYYVVISVVFIFFLFFKAQLAEGISEQEERLAEDIVAMTGCDDCDTRLEMKSLCDLIFHDPIKITFGYVFVLNKRLMLGFCSQLAASLVILLQFVNH